MTRLLASATVCRRLVTPLDPLSFQEYWTVLEVLQQAGHVNSDTRFSIVNLREPAKDFVWRWTKGTGYFATDEQRGKRIAHVTCSDPRGVRNTWPRGISGLTAVVDLTTKQVLRIVDDGSVPIAPTKADYDEASIGTPRHVPNPIRIDQPLGPGFRIDGHVNAQDQRCCRCPTERAERDARDSRCLAPRLRVGVREGVPPLGARGVSSQTPAAPAGR